MDKTASSSWLFFMECTGQLDEHNEYLVSEREDRLIVFVTPCAKHTTRDVLLVWVLDKLANTQVLTLAH